MQIRELFHKELTVPCVLSVVAVKEVWHCRILNICPLLILAPDPVLCGWIRGQLTAKTPKFHTVINSVNQVMPWVVSDMCLKLSLLKADVEWSWLICTVKWSWLRPSMRLERGPDMHQFSVHKVTTLWGCEQY